MEIRIGFGIAHGPDRAIRIKVLLLPLSLRTTAEYEERNGEDSDGDLESKVQNVDIIDSDAVGDEDYVPSSSEGSSTEACRMSGSLGFLD